MNGARSGAANSFVLNLGVWIIHAIGFYMFTKVDSGTAHDLLPTIRIVFGAALLVAITALVVGVGAGRERGWTPAPILAVVVSVISIGLTLLYLAFSELTGMMI